MFSCVKNFIEIVISKFQVRSCRNCNFFIFTCLSAKLMNCSIIKIWTYNCRIIVILCWNRWGKLTWYLQYFSRPFFLFCSLLFCCFWKLDEVTGLIKYFSFHRLKLNYILPVLTICILVIDTLLIRVFQIL